MLYNVYGFRWIQWGLIIQRCSGYNQSCHEYEKVSHGVTCHMVSRWSRTILCQGPPSPETKPGNISGSLRCFCSIISVSSLPGYSRNYSILKVSGHCDFHLGNLGCESVIVSCWLVLPGEECWDFLGRVLTVQREYRNLVTKPCEFGQKRMTEFKMIEFHEVFLMSCVSSACL